MTASDPRPLGRTEALAAVFARAGGRRVWVYRSRDGKGGVLTTEAAAVTLGHRVPAGECDRACVEGDPGETDADGRAVRSAWVKLPL